MILLLWAHPYPQHSRAGRALLDAVTASGAADVEVRSLYDLYPDYDIDIADEQAALTRAKLVVWMHPMYWYSVPALLKHWFDAVLARGWAYPDRDGNGGTALQGKSCMWVTTTGGTPDAFSASGRHQRPFDAFVAPIEQTAHFCGMQWLPPLVLHGAHTIDETGLQQQADELVARLNAWRSALGADVESQDARHHQPQKDTPDAH
jgi:glutathione-regulated potassium-efflux system ancillary protein KefF